MMREWTSLLNETALAAIFPNEYARFVRPIREGLIVFLESLPAAHQAEILAQQAALPLEASFSERLTRLARCCPTLHKLGQVLARDQRLAPELRVHLRELESLSPSVSDTTIQETIRQELGPLECRGIRLVPPAIAEASVAVVIPFIDTNHNNGDGCRNGVLKVLKPGIKERLDLELELLSRVGSHLDERCQELRIPPLDYEDIFDQIREKLRHEVQLNREQQHLQQAGALFADDPNVCIPALFEQHCTLRITAMERISGGKVTDHKLAQQSDKRRLTQLVIRALIARPMFSRAAHAMFHGDPHAGNLFLTDDNRLGVLDWSLVGSLSEAHRVAIVQVVLGAITLNSDQIVGILVGLSERNIDDRAALTTVVQNALRQVRQGIFPGMSWLVDLLDDAMHFGGLRPAADLLLFRKSLHALEGVIADIGAGVCIDDVLFAEFLQNFTMEWPRRWLAPPHSRAFATRLSNLDLTRTVLSYTATVARFWMGQSFDWLDACSKGGTL
jgi:ubiquinone biosynthesis protein